MEKFEGLPFFRCVLCGEVVSVWDVKSGKGCGKCGGRKIKSTNLTPLEMVRQLIKHPKIWEWKNAGL
jgi:hypothetical protein